VISNERLVRAIFKFEREGSRGVYELPTKEEVIDVLYVRDLTPAVILKLSSNRYCLSSFLPLLFDKLRETEGLYYGDFHFTRAGRISDPSSWRDFVLAFWPLIVEFEAAFNLLIEKSKINSGYSLSLAKYRIEICEEVRIFEFYYSSSLGKPRLFCKSR